MRSILSSMLSAALLTGCAVTPGVDRAATARPQAHCLVCKANADLACIDVAVNETTPSYAYNGKTYYFCSSDCRDAFAQRAAKYARG